MNYRGYTFFTNWLLPAGIFVLALASRAPALGGFVTIDEPRWLERSRWFLSGVLTERQCPPVEWGREFATQGWGCTFQIGYPGVTTMWGGSLGLWLHAWQSGVDLPTLLSTVRVYPAMDPNLIAPMRLPFALAGALFVLLFYLLLRRLLAEPVALAAALLVALHPFHIGLSRIIHHDGLNTMFMVLSALALIGYWLRGWPWGWLLFSAVMGGLAFLSKQVSWFMLPYVGALAGVTLYYRWHTPQWRGWTEVWRLSASALSWAAIAALTFVAFFPAMWVMPGQVIRVIFSASTQLAEQGQPHYFLGQITNDPGWLFYPLSWLLRSSPLEGPGLLLALAASWPVLGRPRQILNHPVETGLALFVVLLGLFVNLSNKKLDRYFLPAFPVIDVFVAIGLFWLAGRLADFSYLARLRRWAAPLAGGIILWGQGGLALAHYPYYFTYYNPLLGGPLAAARLTTIQGWGEGLNEAAAYLNQKPAARKLHVVAEMWCTTFSPFFAGQANCLNSSAGGIMAADYLVYYYNVTQRRLAWPEQWRYFNRHYLPEHRITLHGLDYVLIYRNPIQNHIKRQPNSLARVFTTFGYNLASDGQLTLFWQNLGMGQQRLQLGLAPSRGVYAIKAPTASPDPNRRWVTCQPQPAFSQELNFPKAIIESLCPLDSLNLPPGLYDLQLGLSHGPALTPLQSSLLGLLLIKPNRHFSVVELKPTLAPGNVLSKH